MPVLQSLPHLFLCRHGQTDWNAEGRLQGQVDIDLNAHGRSQAARNGERLRERLGDGAGGFRFLASPMRRARETMEIVRSGLGLQPDDYETDDRLIELNFGDWQGSTLAEVAVEEAGELAAREASKWDYLPPGSRAESYAMLAARVAPLFAELTAPTVLVAHGGVIRSFLRLYCGYEAADASHVDIPQDRILEATAGGVAWI